MAYTTILSQDKKLGVAETLDQATQALAAHRAWMKRRAQNSVLPTPSLVEDLDPPAPKQATWAIQPQAPPPNAAAGSSQGERSRSRRKSSKGRIVSADDGAVEVEKEKGGGGGGKSSTAQLQRSLDHFISTQEGAGQGVGHREAVMLDLSPTVDGIKEGGGEAGSKEHPRKKTLAKKRSSVSKITPISTPTDNNHLPLTSASNPAGHTSPSVFISTDSESKMKSDQFRHQSKIATISTKPAQKALPNSPLNFVTVSSSPPPEGALPHNSKKTESSKESSEAFNYPLSAINAWASTSSLDRYIESLSPKTPDKGAESHISSSAASKRAHADIENEIQGHSPSEGSERSDSVFRTSKEVPSPQSDLNSSFGGEHDIQSLHIHSLQQASSATIVAVSPAPRELRTSYTLHGQSKLNRAEANRKVFHFEATDTLVGEESASEELVASKADWDENRRRTVDIGSVHQLHPEVITVASRAGEHRGSTSPNLLLSSGMPPKPPSEDTDTTPSLSVKPDNDLSSNTMPHPTSEEETADSADVMATSEAKQVLVQPKKSMEAKIPPKRLRKSEGEGGSVSKPPSQSVIGYKARGNDGSSVSKIFVQPLSKKEKISAKRAAGGVVNGVPPSFDRTQKEEAEKKKDRMEEVEGELSPPVISSSKFPVAYSSGIMSVDHTQKEEEAEKKTTKEEEVEQGLSPPVVSSSKFPVAYSAGVTSVHSSTTARTEQDKLEGLKAINLPPLKKLELTDIYLDGTELVKNLPPLKLTSPLSPNLDDFTLSGKRAGSPPSYEIHRPKGGMALAPPCPPYGMDQPSVDTILRDPGSARVNISGVASSLAHSSHMPRASTATSKPQNLSMVQDESVGEEKSGSPAEDLKFGSNKLKLKPPLKKARSVADSSQDAAAKRNKNTSTLILKGQSSRQSGGRGQGRSQSVSELERRRGREDDDGVDGRVATPTSAPLAYRSFSFVGSTQGPGHFHLTAKCGNLRLLQSLLAESSHEDLDMPDHEGRTALMYCVQTEGVHLGCADALIKAGASINKQTSDGSTALHLAASIGAVSVIELLLINGAKPDVQDFEGRRPIHWATMQKGTKTFTVLLKSSSMGVNCVDDAGMTVLMWAAYHNNPTVVSFLIDRGADVEEKDEDGCTAMHWAIHKESSHCLQLLLKPDMTYFKDHKGKTVMHVAAEKGSMAACEVILKLRPDAIHDTDKMGRTPLHYAAALSRVDVSALLLDYGADATHRDTTSRTPLHYARDKKLDYVVALLSCHGNAVADFARVSRSTSLASILSRSISFGQLPLSADSADSPHHRAVSPQSPAHLSRSLGSLAESAPSPSQTTGSEEGVDVCIGDYLGRFFPEDQESVKHYYLRLIREEGAICWARSKEACYRKPDKALVLSVSREPSNTVKKIPKFSPNDLHCYTFCVLTGGGALDLFAYNEDAFVTWTSELEGVASKNATLLAAGGAHGDFKNSSVHSRPSSSRSIASRTSVVPAAEYRLSHDGHVTSGGGSGNRNRRIDASVFVRPNDSPVDQSGYKYSGDII